MAASNLVVLGVPPSLANRIIYEINNQTGPTAIAGNLTVTGDVIAITAGKTVRQGVATGLTATGTVLADALQLTQVYNNVTTAALNTGVKLWNPSIGSMIIVKNMGANDLKVWPADASGVIDNNAAGANTLLSAGTKNMGIYIYVATNTWISCEAGSA